MFKWSWGDQQQEALTHSKEMLTSSALLVHYFPTKPLLLSCDASQHGAGAMLSQVCGSDEKPVAYASRAHIKAERNYSQLDKEGLDLVFGVKKFHNSVWYVEHLRYEWITSHYKASNDSKPIPCMESAHIQRWALTLASYGYIIKYRSGQTNSNTNALSRHPLPDSLGSEVPVPS